MHVLILKHSKHSRLDLEEVYFAEVREFSRSLSSQQQRHEGAVDFEKRQAFSHFTCISIRRLMYTFWRIRPSFDENTICYYKHLQITIKSFGSFIHVGSLVGKDSH